MILIRSSHSQVFFKTAVLKIFAKFSEKHLCWSFLMKLQAQSVFLLKKRLQHSCFPVSFTKFLRTFFFYIRPLGNCFCLVYFPERWWYWNVITLSNEIMDNMFFSRLLKLKFILVNIIQFGSYNRREILSRNGGPEHLKKQGSESLSSNSYVVEFGRQPQFI